MIEGRGSSKQRMIFSLTSSAILIVSILLASISIQVPYASASSVDHNIGKLDINTLTDYGRILAPITWASIQTTDDPSTGSGFIGLVIDQNNYNHALGSEDIADSFSNHPYFGGDDFTMVSPINMIINDGVMQKSIASFQNTGTGTGDPNDTLINQTVWTVKNKDWAILQWTLNNLKSVAINNVCFGLELPLSQVGARHGLGGDSGDDVDGFDAGDNIYWAQDDGGTGTCIGFGSAIVSDPITHYYSEDYHPTSYDQYKLFWENDTWLYNRLHSTNAVVGATPGNRTSTVGWNDITIDTGSSRTLTLVIAINDTFDNMKKALKDAQLWYRNIAIGFRITEFSDDRLGTQQIEVYNIGPMMNLTLNKYFLSNDGGLTPLPGNWIPDDTIPTCGYRVFQVTGTLIGPEGDTLGLYQDLGGGNIYLIDRVSYGQEGVAPDPLDGESVARRFDVSTAEYMNEWLRNASTGPTWGAQNDVGYVISPPTVVLNRVMFNPLYPAEGYVELKYKVGGKLEISGYRIVCDDVFMVPSGTALNSSNRFYVLTRSNYPLNFDLGDGSVNGDNVYLYDSNGNLLDMVGWSSSHNQGEFMSRIPDGNGTHQGYDDVSSQCAGWAFDQLPNLVITEFFANSISAQIEVYNPRGGDKVLDAVPPHWTLESSVSGGTLTGSWNSGTIPANGGYDYFIMDPGGGIPGEEGDTIRLYYIGSELIDEVSFGTFGVAPDPLFGESTARYWYDSILGYTNHWTRNTSTGPTWGSQNDVPEANFVSSVKLNEVLFDPNVAGNRFVEIYNTYATDINISGYKLVCDTEYIVPDGTILNIHHPFFYLFNNMNPTFFSNMSSSGDNVYLYDTSDSLVDMVGWDSSHTGGRAVSRFPNGNGTRDGYDDISSIAAGWLFDRIPSIPLIQIHPPYAVQYGHRGKNITYHLGILSKHGYDDVVDISNVTGPWGWEIIILDENGNLLNDSNGNGLRDIFIPPGGQANITVVVKVPPDATSGVNETTIVTARSTFNFFIADRVTLMTRVYPYLLYNKTASPKQINILGTGYREETMITLNVSSNGSAIGGIISDKADIIFVVDDTSSMFGILEPIKQEILNLTNVFLQEFESIRFGLVTYDDDYAEWDQPLTFNINDFTKVVLGLIPAGGGIDWPEDVYGGLELAVNAAWRTGNVSKVIILIGDAEDHDPYSPCPLVFDAHKDEWGIYTSAIACSDFPLATATFKAIAENGRGVYAFYDGKYNGNLNSKELAKLIINTVLLVGRINVVAKDLNISDSNPMIRDVLPDYIHYIDGSATKEPDVIYMDKDGNTILEWNITNISIGQSWEVKFNVTSSNPGLQLANVVSESRINYTTWDDCNLTFYFPEVWINVVDVLLPPKPRTSIVPGTNHIRLEWVPPPSPSISHYLIYRTTDDPTTFDFSIPQVDTSLDTDPIGLDVIGPRTSWNFTDDVTNAQEVYYCIRAVNSADQKSITSYTVGKWTKNFPVGICTFSLPLEPFETKTTEWYTNNIPNCNYIRWMNSTTHNWVQHDVGEGLGVEDGNVALGEGYEISVSSDSVFTFTGRPGAHIRYIEGELPAPTNFVVNVVNAFGDVGLTWDPVPGADHYIIYRSSTREGLNNLNLLPIGETSFGDPFDTSYTDFNVASLEGTQYYYIVVAVNGSNIQAGLNSTYSIGVWTEGYLEGYDTLGIPLKLSNNYTADWYCDNIPDTVGINYFIHSEQRWCWHSKRMPGGAYDPILRMTEGYQISTSQATKFTFIGI